MSNDDKNYELSQKHLYRKLSRLYENNGYYERNNLLSLPRTTRGYSAYSRYVKPLRTVVNRSVEFYASKISVPMQVSTKNQSVQDAIEQVLTWSNFSATKPVALREMALYGNLFWKVISDGTKVYFETIDPNYVSDLSVNSRGYLQSIRIDIPQTDEFGRNVTYTEFWNKEYFATWVHTMGENAPLDTLGDPRTSGWIAELGIDFIPIVQVKFKDIGKEWGVGSVFHCLDKIDEANKEASRLSDLIFRYNKNTTIVSANDKDANGRPMPAPKVDEGTDIFEKQEDSILYLNGLAKVESLIPNINYDAALKILDAMMEELYEDLPELRYYVQKDGNISGRAIRLSLSGAVDRAEEAKNNFVQGLIRVNQIALTLGKYWGIFNLSGSYETGEFDHTITTPALFPMDDSEKAIALRDYSTAGLALQTTLRLLGFDEEFIVTAIREKQEQENQTMVNAQTTLGNAFTNFNAGG